MSIETNKATVRRSIEQILNNKRYDLIDEFFVDTVEFYGTGPSVIGRTAVEEFYETLFSAFPDWHTTIDDMVAEGDRVAVRMTSKATHQGDFEDIPATGKPYTQNAIVIYRLANGKVVESRLQTDMLSMMQQLGLIPAPESA